MDELRRRLLQCGDSPPALAKSSWKTFGDGLSKDINLSALLTETPALRRHLKESGGCVALWRHLCPRGAAAATIKYGPPSAASPTPIPPPASAACNPTQQACVLPHATQAVCNPYGIANGYPFSYWHGDFGDSHYGGSKVPSKRSSSSGSTSSSTSSSPVVKREPEPVASDDRSPPRAKLEPVSSDGRSPPRDEGPCRSRSLWVASRENRTRRPKTTARADRSKNHIVHMFVAERLGWLVLRFRNRSHHWHLFIKNVSPWG